MALPGNEHHVHSDGYRSDRGEPDQMGLIEDVADEIEQIDAVRDVWPDEDFDGPYSLVEYDGSATVVANVVSIVEDTACAIVRNDEYELLVRPE